MRRRSVDLLVKGNKNQVDQRDKQLTAVATGLCSHAALVTSLQSCSERIWRGICSTPPAALQAGCTAGPAQKGTPKVCVCCWGSEEPNWAESNEMCHKCACQSASWDGCWINSNVPRIPAMGIFALCKERMSWPVVAPRSDWTPTVPQDQNQHTRDLAAKLTLQSDYLCGFAHGMKALTEYFGVITEHQKFQGQIIPLNGKKTYALRIVTANNKTVLFVKLTLHL